MDLKIELMDDSYAVIYPHHLLKIVAYILITVYASWLLIEIFYILIRVRLFNDEINKCKQSLFDLVKSRQLSESLLAEISVYFDLSAVKMTLLEKSNCLYQAMPKILHDEITWHCCGRLFMRIPFFRDWPKEVIEHLVLMTKQEVYMAKSLVAEVGVPGEGLMIVDAGVLAVYSARKKETGHLIDGDYFGELSLVTDKEVRASSVVAITCCKILLLEKIQFRHMMRSYPDLFYNLQHEIKKEYETNRVVSLEATQRGS